MPSPLSATPSSVQVLALGPSGKQTVTLAEPGYSGAFSETDTCAPASGTIATLSPTTGTGPSLQVSVTGIAAGSCLATFRDGFGQTQTVAISVTLNGFQIQ